MSYHHCPVRVAEYDLSTHIDELVHEEETAFKHLLMNQNTSLALGCSHKHHAEKVRRNTRPWGIGYIQDRSVKEGIDHITLLLRDEDVIATAFKVDSKSAESVRNHAQFIISHILDGYRTLTHCRKSDEGTDLDHVRKNSMLGSSELLHSCDLKHIGSYSFYLRSHSHEHAA